MLGAFGKAGGVGDAETLCFIAPIQIGNRVWLDGNQNGIQDPGEAGIAGVIVGLYDASGNLVATAETDVDGQYLFSNEPGRIDVDASNFGDGNNFPEQIFGLNFDEDGSGSIDTGDSFSIALYDSNFAGGVLDGFTTSDPDQDADTSNDPFTDIRDSDGVLVSVGSGANSATQSGVLLNLQGPGTNNHSFDFGVFETIAVGGVVFLDNDEDGDQIDETTIFPGTLVALFDENGVLVPGAVAETDADGNYLFSSDPNGVNVNGGNFGGGADFPEQVFQLPLEPNTDYTVGLLDTNFDPGGVLVTRTVTFPNALGDLTNNPVTDVNDSDVVGINPILDSGGANQSSNGIPFTAPISGQNLTLDIGVTTPRVAIGNFVWIDMDPPFGDGEFDGAETGVDGVTVELFRVGQNPSTDLPFKSVVTSGGGFYLFDNLPEGTVFPNYLVHIPAENFQAGGMLSGHLPSFNSTNNVPTNDGDTSNDDNVFASSNGVFAFDPAATGVSSVNLQVAGSNEPTNEAGQYSPNAAVSGDGIDGSVINIDASVNLTVDFAFVVLADVSDAPSATYGIASHIVESGLLTGTVVDLDGTPNIDISDGTATGDDLNMGQFPGVNDEDAIPGTLNLSGGDAGPVLTIPVENATGGSATLYVWIDYNLVGGFGSGVDEFVSVSVAPGATSVVVTLPPVPFVVTPTNTFIRFRITTDSLTGSNSTGTASDGEVEDHLVVILPATDFGDLPDNDDDTGTPSYPTNLNDGGEGVAASHILDGDTVLGTAITDVDAELDGVPSATAEGDDTAAADDENGVVFNTPLVAGEPAKITVSVVANGTDSDAHLSVLMDFDGDGSFDTVATTATSPTLISDADLKNEPLATGSHMFHIDVPSTATGIVATRFRLTDQSEAIAATGAGQAMTGEVEDYILGGISGFVWNDGNENGVQDGGEAEIAGVTVALLDDCWSAH